MPLIMDVFHPASYTVTRCRAYSRMRILRLRTWFTQSRDCAHMLCNPEIACAISGFRECATQSQDCANSQIARNIYNFIVTKEPLEYMHRLDKSLEWQPASYLCKVQVFEFFVACGWIAKHKYLYCFPLYTASTYIYIYQESVKRRTRNSGITE